MIYRCLDCEGYFEKPVELKESMGEHFGFPSFQTFYVCPICGGDYEEVYEELDEGVEVLREESDWGD